MPLLWYDTERNTIQMFLELYKTFKKWPLLWYDTERNTIQMFLELYKTFKKMNIPLHDTKREYYPNVPRII